MQLCSHELAKAAKKIGFNEPCDFYHSRHGMLNPKPKDSIPVDTLFLCPYLEQLQNYILRGFGIWVEPTYIEQLNKWGCLIYNTNLGKFLDEDDLSKDTKDEALTEGLTKACEILKGGSNDAGKKRII